jgi:hypothetical protein
MSKYTFKVSFSTYKGIIFGIGVPMTDYVDLTLCIACFAIHFKFKKR